MSCTNCILGLAVGCMLTDKLIDILDIPVFNYFPEWKQGQKRFITIRHLVNMTSGLQNNTNGFIEIYPSPDFVQLALCAELSNKPGEVWAYNNKSLNLMAMAGEQSALVRHLQDAFVGSYSGATKAWWERYLKGVIEFCGVGILQRQSALADWRSDSGVGSWPIADQFALSLRLNEDPMAEDKLAGVLFLQEYLYDGVPWRESLRQYGFLFERRLIADWNTCDWFCRRVLGSTI